VRSHHPLAVGVAALGAVLLLGGCFTGPRPSFIDVSTDPTGDTAVDQVVASLDAAASGTFTATYDILNKYGSTTVAATISRDDTRTSITIGDVRFLQGPDGTQTCTVSTGTCEQGLNDARVSDTAVIHTFAKEAAATRLRREASSKTAPGETYAATVGDQQVNCVRLTGAGGATQFCALDNGWLALEDVAEVNITLKTLVPTATEALFTPNGTA
jgi:hypothetical protein